VIGQVRRAFDRQTSRLNGPAAEMGVARSNASRSQQRQSLTRRLCIRVLLKVGGVALRMSSIGPDRRSAQGSIAFSNGSLLAQGPTTLHGRKCEFPRSLKAAPWRARPSMRRTAYRRGCELTLAATSSHTIGREIAMPMTGFKSTAAVGRRPLERTHSPKQSLTISRRLSAPDASRASAARLADQALPT